MTWRAWVIGSALICGACSGSRASEPAWPKLHDREADGGESLAPRVKTEVAAAVVADDHAAEVTPVAAAPVVAAPAKPAVAPTVTAPTEEITTEDIVIEVDD